MKTIQLTAAELSLVRKAVLHEAAECQKTKVSLTDVRGTKRKIEELKMWITIAEKLK